MTPESLRERVARVTRHLETRPPQSPSEDLSAVATLESGLRCRAVASNGNTLVSDMPVSLGGGASAPSPGWFMRAAVATCTTTMIAIRAAQLGVVLSSLEVTAVTQSDARGMFGVGDATAGPLCARISVRIGAHGVAKETLTDLVRWADRHSPVNGGLRRAIPTAVEVLVE